MCLDIFVIEHLITLECVQLDFLNLTVLIMLILTLHRITHFFKDINEIHLKLIEHLLIVVYLIY